MPTNDESNPKPKRLSSRTALVLRFAVICALLLVGLWVVRERQLGDDSALVTAGKESASADAEAGFNGLATPNPNRSRRAKPLRPQLQLVWAPAGGGECPDLFSGDVRVIVQRGEVTRARVTWDAIGRKLSATRQLIKVGDEWSLFLTAIPANTTIVLSATAFGPAGEATVSEDISIWCQSDVKPKDRSAYLDYFG